MPKKTLPPEPAAMEAGLEPIRTPVVAEASVDHACLLLFALVDPRRRGMVPAAKATLRARTTLTEKAVRWCWRERVAHAGSDADREAARLYRELYLNEEGWGRTPLDRISHLVRPQAWILLGVGEPLPPTDGPTINLLASDTATDADYGDNPPSVTPDPPNVDDGLTPGDTPEDPKTEESTAAAKNAGNKRKNGADTLLEQARLRADAANEAHRKHLEEVKQREEKARQAYQKTVETFEKGRTLIEVYLGALARDAVQQAQSGVDGLGLKPKDLPKLLEQYRELSEYLGLVQAPMQAGGQIEPSYRVQVAIATGADVLAAMMSDIEECKVVVGVMLARRDIALATPAADPSAVDGAADEPPGAQDEASPNAS